MIAMHDDLADVDSWLPHFVNLLRSRYGLVTNGGRVAMLQHAVERMTAERGLRSPLQLLPMLRAGGFDDPAVRALLRNVTIHESYFFRDERAFDALRTRVLPDLVAKRRGERRLRVWSAGCASGEELYTIAILLAEHCDVEGWHLDLLGTDLDPAVVERAREATFTGGSLRACGASELGAYFEPVGGRTHRVQAKYRRGVRFEVDNLMSPTLETAGAPFDLVVCRNVAIYFDADGIRRLHAKLAAHLAPDGVALLGVLEPRPDASLVPARDHEPGLPFFRLGGTATDVAIAEADTVRPPTSPVLYAAAEGSRASLDRAISRVRVRSPGPNDSSTRLAKQPAPRASSAPEQARSGVDALAEVLLLADRGDHEVALERATAVIEENPLDARPYVVAAMIAEELGRDTAAETLLRRALYLAPDDAKAYRRLALILKRGGDVAGAARAIANADRLEGATGRTR